MKALRVTLQSLLVSALLLADYAYVRRTGDASGIVFGGQLGLRWHDSPWDAWAALDVRRTNLSSPWGDEDESV